MARKRDRGAVRYEQDHDGNFHFFDAAGRPTTAPPGWDTLQRRKRSMQKRATPIGLIWRYAALLAVDGLLFGLFVSGTDASNPILTVPGAIMLVVGLGLIAVLVGSVVWLRRLRRGDGATRRPRGQ